MNPNCRVTRKQELLLAIILPLCPAQGRLAEGSTIPRVYADAFKQIHAGREPSWKGMKDVDAWFQEEGDVIEAVALEWLRAPRDSREWRRGLLLGRHITSAPICDLVFDSVQVELARVADASVPARRDDHERLAGAILVLARCGDTRALPALHRLIADASCPPHLIEEYLRGLQRIGNETSIALLKETASHRDIGLQRQAALTEKIVASRMAGRDLLEDSKAELRTVTRAWIQAVEAQDIEAYLRVLPSSAVGGISQHDFEVELLKDPELPELLAAAKKVTDATDDAFSLDRDRLEASIVVDARYKFLYVVEVDGWKIFGPVRVGP